MTARKLSIAPLLASLLLGCSGAGNQDLFTPGAQQNDTATSPPASSGDDPSQSTDPTEPSGGGSGSGSGSAADPASDPPPPPPAPPVAPACPQESEPNDTLNTANPFTSTLCGQIRDHDDVDDVKIVAPAGMSKMTYGVKSNEGKVTYRLYANGFPIPFDDGALPVISGTTYSFQLDGSKGAKPTWEVDVTFE